MKLETVLEGVEIEYIRGNEDIEIKGVSYDSRDMGEEFLFICIQGYRKDGHEFIRQAVRSGACAVLIDEEIEPVDGITYIKTTSNRKAMAAIASNFNGHPEKKLKLIGVTGTNGKTTTAFLVRDVLKHANMKCGLLGTIEMDDGNEILKANRTTPESVDIHREFKRMVQNGCSHCVMEVSSHSLELFRVDKIDYDISIFTNLTKDHLDFHKTMEEYMKSKQKLFYKTNGNSLINTDDYWGKKIYNNLLEDSKKVVSFGMDETCDFRAINVNLKIDSVEYDLVYPGGQVHVVLPIPGLFSVYNSIGAIAACYLSGIDMETVVEGIELTKKVPGRFEVVGKKDGFTVIVDYAHTPDALEKALKTVKEFGEERIICVFGCCGNRDRTKRPIMGRIAQDYADYFIITSDDPRFEDPQLIIDEVVEGLDQENKNYETIVDRTQAVTRAISLARKGDIVLLAGKGHEDYMVIGDEKLPYDERKLARKLLEED